MTDKEFFDFLRKQFSISSSGREATFNNAIYNRINDLEKKFNEKSEKATCWDIIIKKDVSLGSLKRCKTVEGYNAGCRFFGNENCQLTEEEFDTLKEGMEECLEKEVAK